MVLNTNTEIDVIHAPEHDYNVLSAIGKSDDILETVRC